MPKADSSALGRDIEDSRDAEKVSGENRDLATGGAMLGVAMLLANGANYVLNIFLGRWLSPAEFADASLIVTLMLLLTAIAISLQLISARFTGIALAAASDDPSESNEAIDTLSQWLVRRAHIAGIIAALILVGGAEWWRETFRSAEALPFVILGIGMPFYLGQAVGRGVLQGHLRFGGLAATFVVEAVVRCAVGLVLVALGFGVTGATIGLTASFVAVWIHVRLLERPGVGQPMSAAVARDVKVYALPVAVLLLGQIIVNNGDVLIAKRFLEPETAGVYAAIALVGRAVFFLSWSVATTLFPAAAQRNEKGESADGLLWSGLAVVGLMGVCFVVGARLLGNPVLGRVFGPEYGNVADPLSRYALATSLFALANLIVSHRLSMGHIRPALVLLGGGVVQTCLLLAFRSSIDSLVNAQIMAMALLLLAVVVVDRFLSLPTNRTQNDLPGLDRASEEMVFS